jgi:hypothetical protein
MKTKWEDCLLDNKRLQDRFDSLEFYTKTNTNSSAFHNLNPATMQVAYMLNNQNNGSSGSVSRGRTPAPSSSSSRSSYKPPLPSNLLLSTSNNATSTSTPTMSNLSSRHSSVERNLPPSASFTNGDSHSPTSPLSNTNRIYDSSNYNLRSRQSSPIRSTYDSSYTTPTSNYSNYGSSLLNRNYSPALPSGYASMTPTSRSKYSHFDFSPLALSTDRSLSALRNRREASQERSYRPPPGGPSSHLLKLRRASYVDPNTLSRY